MLKYFEELVPKHTESERFAKKFAIQRRAGINQIVIQRLQGVWNGQHSQKQS